MMKSGVSSHSSPMSSRALISVTSTDVWVTNHLGDRRPGDIRVRIRVSTVKVRAC